MNKYNKCYAPAIASVQSVLNRFHEVINFYNQTCDIKKLLRFEIMIPRSRACLSDKFQHHFNAVHSAVTGIDYTDLLDTV